jgi:hypothetical protein
MLKPFPDEKSSGIEPSEKINQNSFESKFSKTKQKHILNKTLLAAILLDISLRGYERCDQRFLSQILRKFVRKNFAIIRGLGVNSDDANATALRKWMKRSEPNSF